ncbi:MAG: ion transporter [Myxococcota bacterium]|jgi:voltage-gated sodium channel|nr:ion transporter [Myxococcota bacterium]
MQTQLRRIADSPVFQNFVTCVILAAAALVGVETYPALAERHAGLLHVLDLVVIWVFVAEAAIKIGAEGKRPWRYFKDPWNVFDFIIVVACFMPIEASYVMVLRLVRVLRVLKLVRALPKLQVLVGALLKSIPSMAYVTLLLVLLFYLYAVAGTFIFGKNDPLHFGTLTTSALTLFQIVTLEAWADVMAVSMYGCDKAEVFGFGYPEGMCLAPQAFPAVAPVFFVSLILLGTMIVLNLFIGVIMHGMEGAQEDRERMEQALRAKETGTMAPTLPEELGELTRQLGELQQKLNFAVHRAQVEAKAHKRQD